MLLFIDSSEHYDANTVLEKYTGGYVSAVSTLYGRHGKGIQNPNLTIALDNIASSHFVVGGAIFPWAFGGADWFGIGDRNTTYLSLDVLGDGSVRLQVFGDYTATMSSAPDIIRLNRWFFVEMEGDITLTSTPPYVNRVFSNVKIWVDGVLVIDGAGGTNPIELPGSPSEFLWNMVIRGGIVTASHQDDFYVCDGSGPAPFNTVLGDKRIGCIYPNGAGDSMQWTPVGSGISANWDAVDDERVDDEVTYVTASGDGQIDLHQMQDVDTNDTISAIQLLVSGKRTNDGFAFITPLLKQGAVVYAGRARSVPNTFMYRNRDIWIASPSGVPWNDSILNSIQAGYERGDF